VDELLHRGVEASVHQLAQPPTAIPFLVAGDTGPDGYIQVGTMTLANGTPTTLWAADGVWTVPRGTQVDGEREESENFIRNRGDRRVAGACPEVGESKSVTVYCCLYVGQCTENTTTVH
jgi:hypothetical protein